MTVAAKRRRGRPSVREERTEATPETLAKLEPDPLQALLEAHAGREMVELERAADEIRAVFFAVCRAVMRKPASYGDHLPRSRGDMSEHLARAHTQTYLPWAQDQYPRVMEACIDLIVDRRPIYPAFNLEVLVALRDYAKRMTMRKSH